MKAGNFKVDQSACFDGRNWVKISEVPGFSVGAVMGVGPQPVGQTVLKKKQKCVLGNSSSYASVSSQCYL